MLIKLGPWDIRNQGGIPDQASLPVEFGDARLTLYVRWRHCDPWQGHVIGYDSTVDRFGFMHAPWSPDIFSPFEGDTDWLDVFGLGKVPEHGFPHGHAMQARLALEIRAWRWLKIHHDNPDAWDRNRHRMQPDVR